MRDGETAKIDRFIKREHDQRNRKLQVVMKRSRQGITLKMNDPRSVEIR